MCDFCLAFLLHHDIQRCKCRHTHKKPSNKKIRYVYCAHLFTFCDSVRFCDLKYSIFLNVFSCQYSDGRTVLCCQRSACCLMGLSTDTSWKKKSDRNGHYLVKANSCLSVFLDRIKSLYISGIENCIKRPCLRM